MNIMFLSIWHAVISPDILGVVTRFFLGMLAGAIGSKVYLLIRKRNCAS